LEQALEKRTIDQDCEIVWFAKNVLQWCSCVWDSQDKVSGMVSILPIDKRRLVVLDNFIKVATFPYVYKIFVISFIKWLFNLKIW